MSPEQLALLLDSIVQPLVTAIASVVAAWFVKRIADGVQRRASVEVDAGAREALHSALSTGLQFGISKVGGLTREKLMDRFVVAEVMRTGADYANRSVPGALHHFHLDNQAGQQFVHAMMRAKFEEFLQQQSWVVSREPDPPAHSPQPPPQQQWRTR